MRCPNCGKGNPSTGKYCVQCGQPLATNTGDSPTYFNDPFDSSPARSSNRLPLIIGGVALMVFLVAAAFFLLPRLLGGHKGGREILLATPQRGGGFDLSVLRLGDSLDKAVTIAEDVAPAELVTLSFPPAEDLFHMMVYGSGRGFQSIGGSFGGFLPNSNQLIAFYIDGDKTNTISYSPGDKTPTKMLDLYLEDTWLAEIYHPDSGNLTFIDTDQGEGYWNCYTAKPGKQAERVSRRGICSPTKNGKYVYNFTWTDDEQYSLALFDIAKENETSMLDIDELAIGLAPASADASHYAYATDDSKVRLLDTAGITVFESELGDERVSVTNFAGTSDTLWYITSPQSILDSDRDLSLFTSATNGALVRAYAMSILPSPDGSALGVLAEDDDGRGEVSIINSKTAASTKVTSGYDLEITMLNDPNYLLVKEETNDRLNLTAATLSLPSPVTLFSERGYQLTDFYHQPGDDYLLLVVKIHGADRGLYVTSLDGSTGYFALEGWDSVQLFDLSGDTLLFAGKEDPRDTEALYALTLSPKAKPVKLDDLASSRDSGLVRDDKYAFIGPDGRSAIYNVSTGSSASAVAVRQVRLDGKKPSEDLYNGALVVDVAWLDNRPDTMGSDLDSGRSFAAVWWSSAKRWW